MEPIWKNAQSFIDDVRKQNEIDSESDINTKEEKEVSKKPRLQAIRDDLDNLLDSVDKSFNLGNKQFDLGFSEAADVLPEGKIEGACKKTMAVLKSLAQFSNEQEDVESVTSLRALSVRVQKLGAQLVKHGTLGELSDSSEGIDVSDHINTLLNRHGENFSNFINDQPELKSFMEDEYKLVAGDYIFNLYETENTSDVIINRNIDIDALELIAATSECHVYVQGFDKLIHKGLTEVPKKLYDNHMEFEDFLSQVGGNNSYLYLIELQHFLQERATSNRIPSHHLDKINEIGVTLDEYKTDFTDDALWEHEKEERAEREAYMESKVEADSDHLDFHDVFDNEMPSSDKYMLNVNDNVYTLTITEGQGEFSNEAGYNIEIWEKNGVEHRLGGPAFTMNSQRHHYEGDWMLANDRFVLEGITISSDAMPDTFKSVDRESIINLSKMLDNYVSEAKAGSVNYPYRKLNDVTKTILSMTSNDPDVQTAHAALKEVVVSEFSSYEGIYLGKTPESLVNLEKRSADFCRASLVSIRDVNKDQDLSHDSEGLTA